MKSRLQLEFEEERDLMKIQLRNVGPDGRTARRDRGQGKAIVIISVVPTFLAWSYATFNKAYIWFHTTL